MKLVYENKLNVILSELLNQLGVISRSELLDKGRRDVLIYRHGLAIILEGAYSKVDAENDAKRRIEQLDADVALAIEYPQVFTQDLIETEIKRKLQETEFFIKIVVPEDISGTIFELLHKKKVLAKPIPDWYKFNLELLQSLIEEVGQFMISEENIKEAEQEVSRLITDFVGFLSFHPGSETMALTLYKILYELYGFSIGDPKQIKDAIFAQGVLAVLLSAIYYESVRYIHNLDSLQSLATTNGSCLAVEKATRDILTKNYEPIFLMTKGILKCLPPNTRLFDRLVSLASKIASQKTLLRRDFAGKVYHTIVGDWSLRKGLATFFTQIPAAYLLAYIARPKSWRIVDFACGSGTLLVAAYHAASAEYRLSMLKKGVDMEPKEIETEFHTQFIESCYGFDVLGYATQITALNLACQSPETPPKHFSIYPLPLGFRMKEARISLGSLELAKEKEEIRDLFDIFSKVPKVGISEKEERLVQELKELEPFDMVVMNPPFTRATGRGGKAGAGLFGFVSEKKPRERVLKAYNELREKVKENLKLALMTLKGPDLEVLLKDKDFQAYRSIGQAGEGLLFLYLADRKVKKEGKICLVLPKSLLTGTSWFLARALLGLKYHVEHILVSYDAENGYNFSESTSLSECLLVAKKTEEHLDAEETNFVIFLRKPKTSVEAIGLANSLQDKEDSIKVGDAQAFVIRADRKQMLRYLDNWGRFVFLPNLKLLADIKDLLNGIIRVGRVETKIPFTKLNNIISSIGVDAHQFHDMFKHEIKAIPGCVRVVYGGEEKLRECMSLSPNAYALPKGKGSSLFQEKAGCLLVPDRIWIDTAHVVGMVTEEPVLSNMFYALKLKNEDKKKLKALCVWLNTSWGVLIMLASREETRGGWIRLKMSQWRLVPVLDIEKLFRREIDGIAKIFDEFKNKKLERIPKQYGLGLKDKVGRSRVELDTAFLEALGIKIKESDLLAFYENIGSSFRQWLGT